MERLVIRPSVAIMIRPDTPENLRLKVFYSSGTKRLEVLMPAEYSQEINKLIKYGIDATAIREGSTFWPEDVVKLAREFRKRGILVSEQHDSQKWKGCYDRYDRQLRLLSEMLPEDTSPVDSQKELMNKRIVIIGLGGMGSNILQSLAQMGFSSFLLIDPDIVELSNLNRQPIYTRRDVGAKKVVAASNWLGCFVDNVVVETFCGTLKEALAKKVITRYTPEIMVNCADVPSVLDTTRKILTKVTNNVPVLVGGGYYLFKSFIGPLIIPGKTACLDCNLPKGLTDFPQNIPAIGGNIAPVVSIGASISALNVFKYFTRCAPCDLCNKQIIMSLDKLRFEERILNRDESCPTCSRFGE